jgi:hypothetical protein
VGRRPDAGFAGQVKARSLGDIPAGYVDPAAIRTRYATYGTSRSNQNVENVLPPDYAAMLVANDNTRPREGGSGGGVIVLALGLGVGAALLARGTR